MRKFGIALAVLIGLGVGVAPAFADCATDIKTVKGAWDKATDKAKKDAALVHYQAAEKALQAKDEKACTASLDKAKAAIR